MTKLTKRQQEILTLIESHIAASGAPPTRAEIAKTMGFKSPNAAEDHLRALARKGVIELVPGTSRGIRLAQKSNGISVVAAHLIQANLHSHQPIFSEHHLETKLQNIDQAFFGLSTDYLLRVAKSYPELNIQSGDLLAIHQTERARSGQIALMHTNYHGDIELKRLTHEQLNHDTVEGIVIGVIRSLHTTN